MCILGNMDLEKGNEAEAIAWYTKAAENGCAEAIDFLRDCGIEVARKKDASLIGF